MEACAGTLLVDADRYGWRGNTTAWVRRARLLVEEACSAGRSDILVTLAPAVASWRLLRPAMALVAPMRPGGFDVLWADVRHILLTKVHEPTVRVVDVWIGCLVYAVRRRPRMPSRHVHSMCPPDGPLARALHDDCLAGATSPYPQAHRYTLVALMAADHSASADIRFQAANLVGPRPLPPVWAAMIVDAVSH